jgi:flagellar basal-body rod protein FlgB
MWIEHLMASRVTHAIELTAQFAERRHNVLAENVANIDTPDYQTKSLDPQAFQTALREAVRSGDKTGAHELGLRSAQAHTDSAGRLQVRPATQPPSNALFHDGTHASVEALMVDVQENALTYNLAVNYLRARFDGLMTAIRGRAQ